jgi:diaminopimelate epimerase
MRLVKYHGLGNDFLILLDLDGRRPVDGTVARAVCDRHRGAGADGLIRAAPGPRMELFNADGSRAETSGNGLRCLARALGDAGLLGKPEVTIATDAGPRRAWLRDDGQVTVEMGTPTVDGEAVNLGNPHVVVQVADPAGTDLARTAAAHPGVNVEVFAPGPGPDEVTMRVWERGVGETTACGSGACAVAAVAHRRGLISGDRVTVHQPGGDVVVDLSDGAVVLTGPAEYVCDVEFPQWR